MTNSLIQLTETTLSLALAYALHSTLLLIGVAVTLRAGRATSHSLRERLWKLAVVVPLLTSPLQVGSGVAPIPDGWRVSVVSTKAAVEPSPIGLQTESSPSIGALPAADFRAQPSIPYSGEATKPIPPNTLQSAASQPEKGIRRTDEGTAQAGIGTPTQTSELQSSGFRPSSPSKEERVVPLANAEEVVELPNVDKPVLAEIGPTVPAEFPSVAELAPVEPLPTVPSTGEPRTGQPGWPPTEPPPIPRAETAAVGELDSTPVLNSTPAATLAVPSQRALTLDPVAFGFALAVLASLGSGIFLLVVQRGRFWLRLRKCRVVNDGVTRNELDALLKRKEISRRVRLLVSDGFVEPVACGVLRWTIIVPHGVEQRLNRKQIEGLLAHELAHLVRGDTAWLWVGNIVCSCLWFQPLNFLARRRWQQAAEFLSDEWAVTDANVSPLSLAQCLTQIAEWRLDRKESGAILAAGGHRSTLSSRIDSLVQDERPHDAWKSQRRRRAILLGVAAVGIALVWAVPRAEFVHADAPPDREADSGTDNVETERPATADASSIDESRAAKSAHVSENTSAEKLYPFNSPEPWVQERASQKTDDWHSEWNELQAELKGLNADLIRVAELLETYPGNVQVRDLAEQVRARAVSFEARRRSLDERLKAGQKNAAAETVDPFYLEDDVEYFPAGPEFKLKKKRPTE